MWPDSIVIRRLWIMSDCLSAIRLWLSYAALTAWCTPNANTKLVAAVYADNTRALICDSRGCGNCKHAFVESSARRNYRALAIVGVNVGSSQPGEVRHTLTNNTRSNYDNTN